MHTYLETIKQAAISFPAIAIIFTIPYLIYNYKKYGSIMSLRLWIIYSFILYMLITYCLIILPLPSPEKAQALRGHHMQLNPLNFIFDIIKNTKIDLNHPKSLLTIFNNWGFLTTIFNIFMTLPFGFYLRYYFQNNLKQVLIKSFLLSLFFELTQLSGLYFIYQGNYRLFDVDDLITNTLGGLLGFLLAGALVKFLPTRAEIDQKSYDRSQKISLLRRFIAMFFDIVASAIFSFLVGTPLIRLINFDNAIPISLLMVVLFLSLIATITDGRTPGFFMTNIKIIISKEVKQKNSFNRFLHYFIRFAVFILQYILAPYLILLFIHFLIDQEIITGDAIAIIVISFTLIYLLYLFISSIIVSIKKPLFYERLSKTSLINTTKEKPRKPRRSHNSPCSYPYFVIKYTCKFIKVTFD